MRSAASRRPWASRRSTRSGATIPFGSTVSPLLPQVGFGTNPFTSFFGRPKKKVKGWFGRPGATGEVPHGSEGGRDSTRPRAGGDGLRRAGARDHVRLLEHRHVRARRWARGGANRAVGVVARPAGFTATTPGHRRGPRVGRRRAASRVARQPAVRHHRRD